MFYYDTPKTPDGIKIEISYKKGGTTYIRQVYIPYSELVNEQNQEFWQDYLHEKIPHLVDESALHSPEHQAYLDRLEQKRKWQEEQKIREEINKYRSPLHDNLTYIPLGRNLDYEHYFCDYIRKLLEWKFRDDEDFSYLMQRLKRWAAKTCPKHMEKKRPDVAYAIAKCFFIHLPDFMNRADVAGKLEDGYQKTKMNKLIPLYFEVLSQAVLYWNHEKKRQELFTLLSEQSARHSFIQKQSGKLMTMIPANPLQGEPITITYQLTAAEKRAEAAKEATLRIEKLRQEEEERERNALIKYNAEYEKMMKWGQFDCDGEMLATIIRGDYSPVLKKLLAQGKLKEGVNSFLQLLKSISKHFVKDEHYNYFDDMYSPDYECTDLYNQILQQLQKHPDAEAEELLKQGLEEIRQMEAFTSYGYPSLCFKS